jgi:antitoxin HicB
MHGSKLALAPDVLDAITIEWGVAMPRSFDFTVVLEPQVEGGFTVSVPALPEVVTEGDTEAEALAMAEEAIRAVLGYRRDHGIAAPVAFSVG